MPAFPPGVQHKGGANAAITLTQQAVEFYEPIIPIVLELHKQGKSLREIGRELQKRGIKPRINYPPGNWSAAQVRRALFRGLGKPVDVKKDRPKSAANPSSQAEPPKATAATPSAVRPEQPLAAKPAPEEAEVAFVRLVQNGQKSEEILTRGQVKQLLESGKITLDTQYFFPGLLNCRRVRDLFAEKPAPAKT